MTLNFHTLALQQFSRIIIFATYIYVLMLRSEGLSALSDLATFPSIVIVIYITYASVSTVDKVFSLFGWQFNHDISTPYR